MQTMQPTQSTPTSPQQTQPNQSQTSQTSKPSNPPFVKPAETKTQFRPEPKKESIVRKGDRDVPKSFRLSDLTSNKNEGNSTLEKRTNTFTQASFEEAWGDYINLHPEQRILVSAMRTSLPENQGDNNYYVKVAHPAQKQAFENDMANLLGFLRDKLKNDYITIKVDVDAVTEDKKMMTSRELLKKTIQDNPELGKFLTAIDAELE